MPEGLSQPSGFTEWLASADVNIVTTSEELRDPISPELLRAYADRNAIFEYTGPLLDQFGAKRAGVHLIASQAHEDHASSTKDCDVVAKVQEARAHGRAVVVVSMGTVITGDTPTVG